MQFPNYLNENMQALKERFPLIFSGIEYIIKQKNGEFGIRQGERMAEINLQASLGESGWLEVFYDDATKRPPAQQPLIDSQAEAYFFWGIGGGKQLLSTFYETPFSQLIIVEPNLEMLAYAFILNDFRPLIECDAVQIWVETRVDMIHERFMKQKEKLFKSGTRYFETEDTRFAKDFFKKILQLTAFYQQNCQFIEKLEPVAPQIKIGVALTDDVLAEEIVDILNNINISAKKLDSKKFASTDMMAAYLQEEKPEFVLFRGNELYLQDANLWAGEALKKLGIKVIKWYWKPVLHPVNEWLDERHANPAVRENESLFVPCEEGVNQLRKLGFQAFHLPLFAQSQYQTDLTAKETAFDLVSAVSSPLRFNKPSQTVYLSTYDYTISTLKMREHFLSMHLEGKNIFTAKADAKMMSQYISGTYKHMNRQGRLPFPHFYQEFLKEWDVFQRLISRYWNFPEEMRYFLNVIKNDLFYGKWYQIATFLKRSLDTDFHLLNEDFFLLNPQNSEWPVEKVSEKAIPEIYEKALAVLAYNNLAFGNLVDFDVFNAVASGAIVFSNSKLEPFFADGEYILYEAEEDIPEILDGFKSDEAKTQAIREKAMERLEKEHQLKHRLQKMAEYLFEQKL